MRGIVRDFFAVVVDFIEAVSSKYRCASFNEFTACLELWHNAVYEAFLFVRDYLQVVYETRVFISQLLSILNFSPSLGSCSPHLAVTFNSAKLFLKKLFEEGFPKFDEQVHVVWGRMLRLSNMVTPLDRDTAERLRGLAEGEISRWIGEGSAVIDAYNRALKADCEESFVKEVLNLMSGPKLLLDGLKRIASTFAAGFDPASHPLENLSELVQSAKAAAPVVLRGLKACSTVYNYWVNTLFHMLRALYGYDEASKLLNRALYGLSRGGKPPLKMPEKISLEELRVGFIIARANLEDSARELPHFKLMLEKVSFFSVFFNAPFIRDFCRNERELIDHATRSINQALGLAKDANFKIYKAVEELKRMKLTEPNK
ncbi:MAG: hypothetical protein QW461_01245 [Candidatus Jordarchaeales archaeon]